MVSFIDAFLIAKCQFYVYVVPSGGFDDLHILVVEIDCSSVDNGHIGDICWTQCNIMIWMVTRVSSQQRFPFI